MQPLSLPSVHLWYCTVLLVLRIIAQRIIINGNTIWGVKGPDVSDDVVARLGYPAYVTWYRVRLPDVGSSSSHPLDPDQHCLL